ncbi:regenerating islet-derived protein 4-like [Podarcis muralis]|uniref:regenerating islet-derived protein 4-like n=1 Tax=Podarcis muralis TaxID=64176 RepID=UPI00109FAA95|nr:regenerating islet-derived protein 4-like [Podarcis muralis]XP_028560069.1 regenerating islet-derived protein 4-like [Podarcis muralis]
MMPRPWFSPGRTFQDQKGDCRTPYQVSQKMGFVTYFSLCLLGILVSSPAKAACPNGWLQNQGNCYAYIEKMMTWADAEVDCQSYGRGVHLASILNQKECSIVAKYILAQQKTRTDVWIGLYDPLQNRKWKWADNSPFNFASWNVNQPGLFVPAANKFCVELKEQKDFEKWNAVTCKEKNAFVCKQSS